MQSQLGRQIGKFVKLFCFAHLTLSSELYKTHNKGITAMHEMKPWLKKLRYIEVVFLSCLFTSGPSAAQIVPDTTLPTNSLVIEQGNTNLIEGGTIKGSNLFHSFEQFSIPTGSAAYFNNAADIQNIIGRVTGGSISNIDGLIRANGAANLFLLNPNGIIFGPNASLSIGGSFMGSTASSLNFADGRQFSATAHPATPLLTVSVPIGLGLGSNPGEIRVQGPGHSLAIPSFFSPILGAGASSNGLRVVAGETLALVGGDIALEGGILVAPGGRVELGSVGDGIVSINPTSSGWTLGYQGVQNFQDIGLFQQALVDTSGFGNSSIQLVGKQISFADGSVALIQNQGPQAGDGINLRASNLLQLSGTSPDGTIPSGIQIETLEGSIGDIVVSTKHLTFENGAAISSKTFTQASASNIVLNASESLEIKGFSFINPTSASIASGVGTNTFSTGKSGNIAINTQRLAALDGGTVTTGTFGTGNGGDLIINANRSVEVSGFNPILLLPSQVSVATYMSGNAGNLTITAPKIRLYNGGVVNSYTFSSGNAGNIAIKALDFIAIEPPDFVKIITPTSPGDLSYALLSRIASYAVLPPPSIQQVLRLSPNLSGAAGRIKIETGRLSASQGAITVSNLGTGPAGNLDIVADTVSLKNNSSIAAGTAFGDGGNISLQARELQLHRNSTISAAASNPQVAYRLLGIDFPYNVASSGTGNGGNITINTDILTALENSDITANAQGGTGGRVTINTQGIFRSPDSEITATGGSPELSGTVEINTLDTDPSRALVILPTQPVDATGLIAQGCAGVGGPRGSKFVVTGRGGMPEDPNEMLNSETAWTDSRPINPIENQQSSPSATQPTDSVAAPLVEATGWTFNSKGEVVLTAAAPSATLQVPWLTPNTCHAS